jgi:hypothetical protein
VINVFVSFTKQSTNNAATGMPCVAVRLSISDLGATSVALASANLLESTARAISASATLQVAPAVYYSTTAFSQRS